jgi:hypothetical protein
MVLPTSARLAHHIADTSGLPSALTSLQAVALHWPHFLPLLVGFATLRYLWRAEARHRSQGA